MDFRTSKTKDNLMRAFAGECQAYMRYSFAAKQAKAEKLRLIEELFMYTANEERAHAKVFYDKLAVLAGETVAIDGTYPVDIAQSSAELLRMAQHNEYQEHDNVYKGFAEIAKDEGFAEIAAVFYMIADIEKIHGDRFGRFAEAIENRSLFAGTEETLWICLNCGHIYRGKEPPALCPVCRHDRGNFIRFELSPFE